MRIAGLQNLSLVDFPGHLASAVFVAGCNFRCGYCHNPDLVAPGELSGPSEEDVLNFLAHKKEMIEGVVLTGGEPTIYSDLPDFVRRVKDMGFEVKLDTNGSNPGQIEDLFRARLLDYVAMDIKAPFTRYSFAIDRENLARSLEESMRLIMLSTVPYEFRTTCVPGIVDDDAVRSIGEMVKGAKKYCLQQFRPRITYDKKFQNVRPYPKEDILRFRSILEGFAQVVETRGI